MSLFIFSSGFLFGLSNPKIASWSDCHAIVSKKSVRLLVPYFTISAIIFSIKYIAGMFITLHTPVDSNFWKYILFYPDGGFARFLWFIYVLYLIFIIFTLIRWAVPSNCILLLLFLAIYFTEIPKGYYFELDLVGFYLIFFYIGYLYSSIRYEAVNKYAIYLCTAFFSALLILLVNEQVLLNKLEMILSGYLSFQLYYLLQGIFLIFSIYYLSILIAEIRKGTVFKILQYIGIYSPSIYLFHTIFMGGICILARPYEQLSGRPIISIMIVTGGIILPIIFTKYFISKNKIISLLVLGSSMSSKKN